MLVQDFLHHSVQQFPEKLALICDDQRLTYAQIEASANRMANALRANGVNRGDRVAIHLNNSVETVVAVFATLKAGGVFVVVNHTTKPDKLLYILNNARATALIADGGRSRNIAPTILADAPSLKFCVFTGKKASAAAEANPR